MRDFRVNPQFEYCCEQWSVLGYDADEGEIAEGSSDPLNMEVEVEVSIPRVLIAYGSETGTAEAAASRLGRALRALRPTILSLNAVAGLEIIKTKRITHMMVLCSTFGKGQPPSSATKFFETGIPDGILSETQVATLALGSTIYPDYCQAGKKLDTMLIDAGCQKLAPITLADESVDSAGTIAQWIKLMKKIVCPASIEKAVIQKSSSTVMEPLRFKLEWSVTPGKESDKIQPFVWPEEQSSLCVRNEELLVGGDVETRSTRRLGFQVPPGERYVTGDHLSVQPLNRLEVVKRFATCFVDEFLSLNQGKAFTDADTLIEWQLQQPFTIDCIGTFESYTMFCL